MKIALRLLLGIFILFVLAYAAAPWWLPGVINGQLPQGFQLVQFKTGYPGLLGIHIQSLKLSGELPGINLAISARDVQLSYQGFATTAATLDIDAGLTQPSTRPLDLGLLADLSLPLLELPEEYPELSVKKINLRVREDTGLTTSQDAFDATLNRVKLTPVVNGGLHLDAEIDSRYLPFGRGSLEIEQSDDSVSLDLGYPVEPDALKWLSLHIIQQGPGAQKITQAQLDLYPDRYRGDDLDTIISNHTGVYLNNFAGRLSAHALFSGSQQQDLQQMSLESENLQLMADEVALELSGKLNITADTETLMIELQAPMQILAGSAGDAVESIFNKYVPEITRTKAPDTRGSLTLKENGYFVFNHGDQPGIEFNGGATLKLANDHESFDISSGKFRFNMGFQTDPVISHVEGNFALDWQARSGLSYQSGDLNLSAESVSISAAIEAGAGGLTSIGQAELFHGSITEPESQFEQLDIQWQAFDLQSLSGKLSTQTRGFETLIDDQNWKVPDFSGTGSLSKGEILEGSGSLLLAKGLSIPVDFNGSITEDDWKITFPHKDIPPGQLKPILKFAQLELPEPLKLSDGLFGFEGEVEVNDGLTAELLIAAKDLDFSLAETFADDASFSISSHIGDVIDAHGPVSIKSVTLAGGIDITSIEAVLNTDASDTFSLHGLKADLFNGKLSLPDLHYSQNGIADTTVQLQQIDLGLLLAYADIDGLEGSGRLNLVLPLRQKHEGISVESGSFDSMVPGYLKYSSGGMSTDNIGLQALENFQYQQLSGTIDYQPDGKYRVMIKLEGNNPDLYDGYPVRFNLNINGSLPELFETLFVTGDFEEAILKEIKRN